MVSKLDELLLAVGGLQSNLSDLSARTDRLEGDAAAVGAGAAAVQASATNQSHGESSSESSEYSSSEESDYAPSERGTQYAQVQPDCGHWNARQLFHELDQEPHRYSLHGYEVHDGLRDAKHGGGGTLGLALRWMEPACLYFKTGTDALAATLSNLRELEEKLGPRLRSEMSDHLADLTACINTLDGAFELANTYRTIVVERAKVQAPGASVGSKKRQQWVEAQIDEDDYHTADIEPRIRKLKAEYDYEAGRADLKRAANTGGAAAGGGYDRRDRDRGRDRDGERGGDRPRDRSSERTKTKSQKRRERRSRADGQRDERGGREERGDRDRRAARGDGDRRKPREQAGGEQRKQARSQSPRGDRRERESRAAGRDRDAHRRGGGEHERREDRRDGGAARRTERRDGGRRTSRRAADSSDDGGYSSS
jgi:hypothetical protein